MDPYKKKEYVQSDKVTQAQNNLQNHQQTKPGDYVSKWQKPMEELFGQLQNRGPFQYDINSDALYQQAVDRYVQQGQQAMMDTVGQVSALTGGYGNSYAQTAGQHAYQGYLQGLMDKIPQFQQMAMDRYRLEGDDLANRYGMMAQQEQMEYGRYNDSLNRYLAELDRLQGVADREKEFDYNSFWQNQNFDYNQYQDQLEQQHRADREAVEDQQWKDQWQHQLDRDKIKDQQWQTEFDENKRRWEIQLQMQKEAAARASRGGGGGGGGGRRTSPSTPSTPSKPTSNGGLSSNDGLFFDPKNVLDLGKGPLSGQGIANEVNKGNAPWHQNGNQIVVSKPGFRPWETGAAVSPKPIMANPPKKEEKKWWEFWK